MRKGNPHFTKKGPGRYNPGCTKRQLHEREEKREEKRENMVRAARQHFLDMLATPRHAV